MGLSDIPQIPRVVARFWPSLGLGDSKVRPRRLPSAVKAVGYLALRRLVHIVDPRGVGRSARAAGFSGRLSHFVSKRPIWLVKAANL